MLSPIVRDVQRQHCWKCGSGDGQRLSLYDYGTTERSFNAVDRWGSTLTCTVCTAADSEERQICTTCLSLFTESVGLWKRRRSYLYVCFLMYAFSHRDHGTHFFLRGGWGKRGDLTWHPAVKHQRPAAKTTNSNCCDCAAAQVKQHIPEQPGWKNSKYWANIEKRNQINGVYSLKWRLTDRYLKWGTLAGPPPGRADADQCKSSDFLQELRISGFPRFWVSPTCFPAK